MAAIRAAAETAPFDRLSYSEPGGLPELRAVLAEHLNRSRGASAEPDTVSVVMGAGQGMSRLRRALLADGHTAIGMENPGSSRLWQAAQEACLELVPLPVDDDGLVVDALDRHPGLRAVCVGAARQVALGCPLAPHRRRPWWTGCGGWTGWSSRMTTTPNSATTGPRRRCVQGTARDRVALLGSMSQVLGPAVAVGWVVAPRRWVPAVRAEHEIQLLPPALNQPALVQHGSPVPTTGTCAPRGSVTVPAATRWWTRCDGTFPSTVCAAPRRACSCCSSCRPGPT